MTPDDEERATRILASLETQDISGSRYPRYVVDPEDRIRWNQARLIALAIYRAHIPSMHSGEYSAELYALAGSIFRQSRVQFPTGTRSDLGAELADAVERGWL